MTNIQTKINHSIELIRKGEKLAIALNPKDGYFVGFSGGKDSQVLLELVKMSGVKFKAYYSVTTNDPPENVYFIRNKYPEVIFLHPKDNFFKLVEKKGLPTMFHRYCCAYLKENPGVGNVVLTGIRAEESRKRSSYNEVRIFSTRKEHANRDAKHSIESIEENEHRCIKGKDKLMVYPILHWTEDEVWQFIRENNIPINPCYKLFGRVGCMFCPFSNKSQIEYYEEHYPKFKEHFIASLQKYLNKRQCSDKCGFTTAEEYYDWWKSKKSLRDYIAMKAQTEIQF